MAAPRVAPPGPASVSAAQGAEDPHFLLALGTALQQPVPPAALLEVGARMVARHLGALRCIVAEIDERVGIGTIRVSAGPDGPDGRAGVSYSLSGFGAAMVEDHQAGRAFASGDVAADPRMSAADLARYASRGAAAVVSVPLLGDGHWAASIAVHHGSAREWTLQDVVLIQTAAERIWTAFERARTLETERAARRDAEAARQRAEDAASRTTRLQAVTAALAESLTVDDVSQRMVTEVFAATGAGSAWLALLTEDGTTFETAHSAGISADAVAAWRRYPAEPERASTQAVRTGEPIFLETLDDIVTRYPLLAEAARWQGFEAFAFLPLLAGGTVSGTLVLNYSTPHVFDEDERAFLRAIALQCAQAMARARLFEAERRARERAEAVQADLNDVLESMTDALYEYDRDWRIVRLNRMARERIVAGGVDPEATIGRALWECFPALSGTAIEVQLRRAMTERSTVQFEEFSPYTGQWVATRAFPTRDGLVVYSQEITEQRRGREALELLAQASPLVSASLDIGETLAAVAALIVPRFADACTIDLREPDGTVRRRLTRATDTEREQALHEHRTRVPVSDVPDHPVNRVLETGEPYFRPRVSDPDERSAARDPAELDIIRRAAWDSAVVVPLVARGRTLGALSIGTFEGRRPLDERDVALAQDLAQRVAIAMENAALHQAEQRARADAESANRAKMDFLATMSHELRTPLNAIGGYAELIEMGVHGPVTDEQRTALHRLQRSQRHLLSLINDVLNFAKIEAGRLEVKVEPVRLAELTTGLEALVSPQLAAKELGYICAHDDDEVTVLADPEKARQVLLNLLSNAIKYTSPGGTITVATGADGTHARVQVADTGVGIPSDKLDHIFEPFVQLHRSLTNTPEGTGLGLAISRDLARAMGGDLTAASEPGHGSRFTLALKSA